MFESIVIFLYMLVPLINTVGYIPQVVKIFRSSPEELRGVSLSAWALWLFAASVALAYGATILKDPLFIVVAAQNVFWVLLVIVLTVFRSRNVS